MAIFKEDTHIDHKHHIFKLELSEFKKELSDTKEIYKRETNKTVNDKCNDFVTEHGQQSKNLECEFIIKKIKYV